MKIQLIGSTNNMVKLKYMESFSRACARVCYSGKSFKEIVEEEATPNLLKDLKQRGHHSVFEHTTLNFEFEGLPKIMAMIFNNEKDYATSEKSARYTVMKYMKLEQKELYDKWMELLVSEIDKVYPTISDSDKRNTAIGKLAQENARYMTSVFTPTKMVHTLKLRQLNHLIHEFENFVKNHKDGNKDGKDELKKRLVPYMDEFLKQVEKFKVDKLRNQTDRHLSLFGEDKKTDPHFRDTYSVTYPLSFAGLAQAHRHRTINYQIIGGTELGSPLGFFVPKIVPKDLRAEWIADLNKVAEDDFPQAQLLKVYERGTVEDFRSKMILRVCGHAQYEIMENTLGIAREYAEHNESVKRQLDEQCAQAFSGKNPCVWCPRDSLEGRIV